MSQTKQRKTPILDQWIEIRIVDGVTITEFFPPNDELNKEVGRMNPPPELVYRRLHFPEGVPGEYNWTTTDEEIRRNGGLAVQRMTLATWLELIKTEHLQRNGHVGPTGSGSLPRPKDRGGCECPQCTAAQAILDRRAQNEPHN